MVRTLTSNRPASCFDVQGRGAAARSSSTRAKRRSVRFTPSMVAEGRRDAARPVGTAATGGTVAGRAGADRGRVLPTPGRAHGGATGGRGDRRGRVVPQGRHHRRDARRRPDRPGGGPGPPAR